MEVTAIDRTDPALAVTAVNVPPDAASQNRQVVQAVKALNAAEMFGQDNELEFQLDSATKRLVVRIVNRSTREVVSQVPPEYLLRMAEDLKST